VSLHETTLGTRGTFDCNVVQKIQERCRPRIQSVQTTDRSRLYTANFSTIEGITGWRPADRISMPRSGSVINNRATRKFCIEVRALNLSCAYYGELPMNLRYIPETLAIVGQGVSAPILMEIWIRGNQCPGGFFQGCRLAEWGTI
jgi:hypothetical protein